MRPVLAAALLLLGLLTSCGTTTDPAPAAAPPAAAAAGARAAPTALTYPALNIDTGGLQPAGLTDSGALAVPPLDRPETIVYANWSPRLAETMPTVLASHVNGCSPDGAAIPGGFAALARATPGDELTLARADGTRTRYQVTDIETVDKDTFPTEQVYRPGPVERLVLVTCGGDIDTAARSYESNVLVTATPVP